MKSVAVVLVILVLVGGAILAYELSGGPGASSSASTVQGVTIDGVEYPDCVTQVNSVLVQGYEINTFLSSSSTKVGDNLCVNVILLNVDGRNLTQYSDERLSVSYNITETDGTVVDSKTCAAPPAAPQNATTSGNIEGSLSCSGFWFTGEAYDGVHPVAGTYHLTVWASIPYEVVQGMYEAETETTISLSG